MPAEADLPGVGVPDDRISKIVPLTALTVGRTHGPFSTDMPNGQPQRHIVTLTKDLTWPLIGDAVKVTLEESADGGQTWDFLGSITLRAALWRDEAGNPTDTAFIGGSLYKSGPNSRTRVSIDALQPCSLGLELKS